MALHKNDIVSIDNGEGRLFYRVLKLDAGSNRFYLKPHASALKNKEELAVTVSQNNFKRLSLKVHQINAIGIVVDD